MAKRIIKETLKDDSIRYRVETNKFGPFKVGWHTALNLDINSDSYLAVFDNLLEAKDFCNINPVVKREDVTNEI